MLRMQDLLATPYPDHFLCKPPKKAGMFRSISTGTLGNAALAKRTSPLPPRHAAPPVSNGTRGPEAHLPADGRAHQNGARFGAPAGSTCSESSSGSGDLEVAWLPDEALDNLWEDGSDESGDYQDALEF